MCAYSYPDLALNWFIHKDVGKLNPAYPSVCGPETAKSDRISSRSAHVWIIYMSERGKPYHYDLPADQI